jgi:hypothetical protein
MPSGGVATGTGTTGGLEDTGVLAAGAGALALGGAMIVSRRRRATTEI